jgi:large subunit ribosomal protein L24
VKKIRKGDQVIVLSGRDKGRRGAVLEVLAGERFVVENINLVKRHTRPNPQANRPGGIIEKPMPMHRAKIAIWNPATKKPDRVGFKTLADGKKVRLFKSNGEMLDA